MNSNGHQTSEFGEPRPEEWDQFLLTHPEGHHEQSTRHACEREASGYSCERHVLRSRDGIAGGFQILSIPSPLGRMGYVSRGPLALDDDAARFKALVDRLDAVAERRRLVSIRVDTFPTQEGVRAVLRSHGFTESDAWMGKRGSRLIALDRPDEDLLAQMKQKGRYNIKVARREGLRVTQGTEADVCHFYQLHRATAGHQGFSVYSEEYFRFVVRHFGGIGRALMLIAWLGSRPIAAIVNAVVGSRMYYGWGGIDRDQAVIRLMGNYLLHFTAMQWARERGYTHYDLCGDTPFKRRLGGVEFSWPQPLRRFYGPLRSVRRSLMEASWTRPRLRRAVDLFAWRLGVRQRIPF